MSTPVSGIVQIVARNIAPLVGILLLGWNARNILYLYFIDTLLALAVIIAGAMRYFHPPVEEDGWAARINGEVGVVAGGVFVAAVIAVPLGVWLVFMLQGDLALRATFADPNFRVAAAWQAIAALSSYLSLADALRVHTPDSLRLKRRFGLVLLRWVSLIFFTQFVAFLPSRFAAVVFVALYAAISTWTDIAPDHFLRVFGRDAAGDRESESAGTPPAAAASHRSQGRKHSDRRTPVMSKRSAPPETATRRIGDATGLSGSTNWIMAALLGAAAVATIIAFDIRFVFDLKSPDFTPFVGIPLFLGFFALKSLYSAVRTTMLGRRFGESTLEMSGESVPLGGTLTGRIRPSARLAPTGDYTITLRCIEQVRVATMKVGETRTEDHVRWEAMRKLPPASVDPAQGIPFEFAIPDKALAIGDERAKGDVRWTLEVSAPQQGLDYYALFGVIVRPKGT